MGFFNWLGGSQNTELPDIYPMPIKQDDFVAIDVQNIYTRILTDVMERTSGVPENAQPLLWDNCLGSERQDGLVTLIAKAMSTKSDLYLVYNKGLNVLRIATEDEKAKIREGYKKKAEPVSLDDGGKGVYVTFAKYTRTDMVKFYSLLEYCSVGGLWKQGNISKAIQLKFTDLRGSVSLGDSADTKTQAKTIATGLASGKDIMLDAKDIVETAKPDLTATTASIDFIAQKRSFYLGMPATYLTGEQAKGLGDSGKGDTKATERGLKAYYFSIAKPVVEQLFGVKTTFKSEDSEGLSAALETLKTMDTTSDEFLNRENKTKVVNKAFGFDENEKGDPPKKVETPPPADPNAPPPKVPAPAPPPKA